MLTHLKKKLLDHHQRFQAPSTVAKVESGSVQSGMGMSISGQWSASKDLEMTWFRNMLPMIQTNICVRVLWLNISSNDTALLEKRYKHQTNWHLRLQDHLFVTSNSVFPCLLEAVSNTHSSIHTGLVLPAPKKKNDRAAKLALAHFRPKASGSPDTGSP